MTFTPIALYTPHGDFVGWAIKGENKLQSTNIYAEGEEDQLQEQIERLNNDLDLRQYWPHPQDPEVVALLDDKSFMSIEYVEQEVIDEDNSYYVYKKIAGVDDEGQRAWVDSDEIDEEASVIALKMAQVPARPTDVMWRIKKACEQVARQRAGLI